MKRRTVLKGSLVWVMGAQGLRPASVWGWGQSADLILNNGTIATMNDKQPFAESMAIRNGKLLAVGTGEETKAYQGNRTEVIDLAGKGVCPGLIDAHSHVMGFGQMELDFVNLRPPKVNSFETLKAVLVKAAAEVPPGQWIVGRGFNTFKEGRFPRRQELDEAVPKHPLLIIHWGGQFGVANTLGMKTANLLDQAVPDPYGGKFLRDPRTKIPDGVLIHYPAIYSVYQPELELKDQIRCAEWGFNKFLAEGVTCIHDNFCPARYAGAYVRLERSGRLQCRLRVYPYVKDLKNCLQVMDKLPRYEGSLVRLQGIKLAVDGYALMYKILEQHRGLIIPMHPQPQFEEIIATIHKADFQVDVHAVGDKGVDWTLQAFAKASGSPRVCQDRRHRIEHYPFLKKDSLERTAEYGIPVCVQPDIMRVKADDFREKFGPASADLVETMVPLKSFTKTGVHVAYGADVPAFPSYLPLDSIRAAMERKTTEGRQLDLSESITFLEALQHHTLGSAYAAFDENELGSLEPGKKADFVIWNQDLKNIHKAEDIQNLKVQATYLEGKAVYRA